MIDNRRKVGFNAPLLDYLDTRSNAVRQELLSDSPIFDIVRRDAIERLLERTELPNSQSKFLFYFVAAKHLPRGVRLVKWCRSCILPDTRPNLTLDADGICNACRNHGTKRQIDWNARAAALRDAAATAKAAASGYDCLIPVCGGKDSTWQTVKCLELGLKPLAVTWRTPARTADRPAQPRQPDRARRRSHRLQVDPKVERKLMLKAFERFGSTAIAMHLALFAIPLTLAVRFRIPLVVWGENSAFEYGNAEEAHTGFALDGAWLKTYGVTHGTQRRRLGRRGADRQGPHALFLALGRGAGRGRRRVRCSSATTSPGTRRRPTRVARAHGFREDEAPRTGYYDYADIDDDFISMHHWMKWYKFGFTRLFDNLSLEIRNGRMTRDRRHRDPAQDRRRHAASGHRHVLPRSAASPRRLSMRSPRRFRNPAVWQRRADGTWYIPGFLIEDWHWT